MFDDLKKLEANEKISKNDVLEVLKKWAKKISVFDIMTSTYKFREACKYVRNEYKGHFDDIYVKNFYMRVGEIAHSQNNYEGYVPKEKFIKAIDFFTTQDKNRDKEELKYTHNNQRTIYYIICVYTTFIVEEPIHHVGSTFPGHTKVKEINGKFYCPVKANNTPNSKAVCRFCLSVQG
ncbi:MAG: DUF2115 family protein [Methanobrevibacter sp.]|jgi:uncharacterized protein (UPF0305 family)|nr:DUF2115 family protein [Methanobrevibacter sp.]